MWCERFSSHNTHRAFWRVRVGVYRTNSSTVVLPVPRAPMMQLRPSARSKVAPSRKPPTTLMHRSRCPPTSTLSARSAAVTVMFPAVS